MRQCLAGAILALMTISDAAAQTRPPGFVDVATHVPGIAVEARYASPENFIGTRIEGYEQPVCLLTRQAADALAAVQADLAPQGLGLKVFDCYRPVRAVSHFIRWSRDRADQRNKAQYYRDIDKADLFRLG